MREHERAEGNEHEEVSEYEEESEHEGERVGEDDNIGHDDGALVKARGRGGNGLVKAREVDSGSHGRVGVKGGDRRTRACEGGMEYGGGNDSQRSVLVLRNLIPEGYDRPGRTTGCRTRVLVTITITLMMIADTWRIGRVMDDYALHLYLVIR